MIETHKNSRHPFEVYLVAIVTASGAGQLVSDERPQTITVALGPVVQNLWSWTALLGGLICLTGIAIRDEALGLYLERAGLAALAGVAAAYGAALIFANGLIGSLAGPFFLGFAAACAIRVWQIIRVLRRARREATELFDDGEDVP